MQRTLHVGEIVEQGVHSFTASGSANLYNQSKNQFGKIAEDCQIDQA